jgi:hypothetical protein
MTDTEFSILDELYFVTSYGDLRSTISLTDEELCQGLQSLLEKGYIRIHYPDQDTEHEYDGMQFRKHCHDYFYLATKAGLVVHNSI